MVLAMAMLVGCTSPTDNRLKVSATTWIGYTPLFYAKAQGWLEPHNIQLVSVVSLSENLYLFEAGNADAYAGTQYEYSVLSQADDTLLPVMMFNRSDGGDVVLSNAPLEALQTAPSIDVYLEIDSINQVVLNDFVRANGLDPSALNYQNRDQAFIATLAAEALDRPTLIVTYNPYDLQLRRQGFAELASTASGLSLLVVDALFTREATFIRHEAQFRALKQILDEALQVLENNPVAYFEAISPYLLDISYEDFLWSLDTITWLNQGLPEELKLRLLHAGFPVRGLVL
ncbi:MAG: ABC transporter substrate-binding protein [Saccharospirillum sp.]